MPQQHIDTTPLQQDTAQKAVYLYQHVFSGHELTPKSGNAIINNKKVAIWPAGIFILALCLLITIRVSSAKKFFLIFKSFFSLAAERQLLREDYRLNKGSSVLFSLVFLLNFSFFLFKVNDYYGYISYAFNDIFFFLICLLFLVVAYSIRIILLRIFAALTKSENEMSEYLFTLFITANAWGFFLFPLVIAMEYSQISINYLMIAGGVILGLFYAIRLIKGIIIAYVPGRFSVFHLFLYFCALEILPLIVTIKLLVSKFF